MKNNIILKTILVSFCLEISFSEAFARQRSSQFYKKFEKSFDQENYSELIKLSSSHRYYFTGLYFWQNSLATGKVIENLEAQTEKILHFTGHTGALNLPIQMLSNAKGSTVEFIKGEKSFKSKDYNAAAGYFKNVPSGHPLRGEAALYLGRYSLETGSRSSAYTYFEECESEADTWYSEVKGKNLKRHYQRLKDLCMANRARVIFEEERFDESEELFSNIDKRHELWPFLIMDRAWSMYRGKNFNKALGLLSTFKAPLVASYFDPEVEVLTAQSYFKLCLFEDALIVIEHFYNYYRPLVESMRELTSNEESLRKFLKSDLNELEKTNPMLRHLLVKLIRGQNFKRLKRELILLAQEKRRIKDWQEGPMKDHILKALEEMEQHRRDALLMQLKKAMVDLINRTHEYSKVLFHLKLEILGKNRDLVYEGKSFISDRARGRYDLDKVKSRHNFYPVHGEFWADEFGDYTFGLENNCEEVKSGVWEEIEGEVKDSEKSTNQDDMNTQNEEEEGPVDISKESQPSKIIQGEDDEEFLNPELEFPDLFEQKPEEKGAYDSTEFKTLDNSLNDGP